MASAAGIPAWELGVGVGKPKTQPSSVVTLHHHCSALLPYFMLIFWNYSSVPQVTFPLLSEHSGSESAAFLGTAALPWECFCCSGDGTGRGLGPPQPSQHLGMESLAAGRTVGLLLQVEI